MRPIDLFECFIAIGRVNAGIVLSRASGKTDAEVQNSLKNVIELLPPFLGTWIAYLEKKAGANHSQWPPNNIADWEQLIKRIEYIAQTDEPEIEALWRIASAFGYILWIPVPQDIGNLLAEQLRKIKLNEKLIKKIINDIGSDMTEQRLSGVEIINALLRAKPKETKLSDSKVCLAESINDILLLQPNFFGVGVNLNSVVKKWLQ